MTDMIDFEVTKITDHPDGTATIEVEMNEYTMQFLIRIGMLHLFELAAGRLLDGYGGGNDGEADMARNDDCVSCSQSAKNNEHEEGSGG